MQSGIKKSVYILFICLLMGSYAIGQPNAPSNDPDTVPITGLEILLGAGAILGVKRLFGRKKEEKNS